MFVSLHPSMLLSLPLSFPFLFDPPCPLQSYSIFLSYSLLLRFTEVAALHTERDSASASNAAELRKMAEKHEGDLATCNSAWQGRLQEEAERHSTEVRKLTTTWEEKLNEQEKVVAEL